MEWMEQPTKVLEQFAAGELEAFETLFRQFQSEVYRWIVRIVRDPAAAEDLTVETFWRIYRARARFNPGCTFGAWARRIATNVALDYLKSARMREAPLDENLAADSAATADGANPAIRREMRERTQLAFRQLPAKLRVVATLALVEERPQSEIADAINVSTGTVKARLFRGVRLLQRN